ncbi:MAG: RNA chaperone Hfq [Acidobacteriota bacterium]|nr:RNA chaperone Hfq [Acidobacteriota bacterium]
MSSEGDVQTSCLDRFCKEGLVVAVWLVSGKRLLGKIKAFDRFTILLEHGGANHLVFKHAVATIGPARDLPQDASDAPDGSR